MAERISNGKISREKGWLYFLGEDGYTYKVKESVDSRKQSSLIEKDMQGLITSGEKNLLLKLNEKEMARAQKEKIRVSQERIAREPGYLYFIDKEGYVARARMARR